MLYRTQTNLSSGPKKHYHNNTKNSSEQEIAGCFNTYFTSINASLASKFKAQVERANPNILVTIKESFSFSSIDSLTNENLLNSVNIQKASGFDQMSAKLIKLGASAIAPPLAHVVNESYSNDVFPDNLKIAKAKSLHKIGIKIDCKNYRPL